ncbi:acyl-CoA dehydrogenase family protein, partial [Microbispora sp. GKU 823]|uniref:acyl-CoA dehydrogenase family protein n=1 Tax=Microbispora sp. GKU 823 TaxID=1652100 RepID=UPI00118082B3
MRSCARWPRRCWTGRRTRPGSRRTSAAAGRTTRGAWKALAQAGLLGACLPPEAGGAGLGPLATAVIRGGRWGSASRR